MNEAEKGIALETGVDDRYFTPTAQWLQALEAVRARERRLAALIAGGERRARLMRLLLSGDGDAPERDLRERKRVLNYLRSGAALPQSPDDFLRLWDTATLADARVYDTLPAHFRRDGEHIPFTGPEPCGLAEPPHGRETVPPGAILTEIGNLLRWLHTETPPEIKAVTAYFLLGRIHPFCDGNGRTLRMLVCGLLSGSYSELTLLSFIERLQKNRLLLSEAECRTNGEREDLSGFGCLLLRILGMAQNRLEIITRDGAKDGKTIRKEQ